MVRSSILPFALLFALSAWISTICLATSAPAPDHLATDAPYRLDLTPRLLQSNPTPEIEEETKLLVERWMQDNDFSLPGLVEPLDHLPSSPPLADPDMPSKPLAKLKVKKEDVSQLILDVIHFAQDFAGRPDSSYFNKDFRAQFTRAIGERWPGYAWIILARRTSVHVGRSNFRVDGGSVLREGGGFGIQIPVLGSRDLWLKDGDFQFVLRPLPIAGNVERLRAGVAPFDNIDGPHKGLAIRPSLEAEAAYRQGITRSAIRILVQPRLLHPKEVRMLAEVYVNIDIPASMNGIYVRKVSIIPRCMLDLSNEGVNEAGLESPALRLVYERGTRIATCSISTQLSYGF